MHTAHDGHDDCEARNGSVVVNLAAIAAEIRSQKMAEKVPNFEGSPDPIDLMEFLEFCGHSRKEVAQAAEVKTTTFNSWIADRRRMPDYIYDFLLQAAKAVHEQECGGK